MGRKKSDLTRTKRYSLRLNEGEQAMLHEVADETGLTFSEILRVGVRMQYRELRKKSENLYIQK